MGYALRHIGEHAAAFREFLGVLKPGGITCVIEITRAETRLRTGLLKAWLRAYRDGPKDVPHGFEDRLARELLDRPKHPLRLQRHRMGDEDGLLPGQQVGRL